MKNYANHTNMPSFDTFKNHMDGVSIETKQFNDNIFKAKCRSKGAGVVDLNVRNSTINVGVGSKHLEAITEAMVASGLFTLVNRTKGWTTFQTNGSDYLDCIRTVVKAIEVIDAAVPQKPVKAKAPKAAKAKASTAEKIAKAVEKVAKPQSAAQIMRAAEIKAKNLATMKAVTAKQNAA